MITWHQDQGMTKPSWFPVNGLVPSQRMCHWVHNGLWSILLAHTLVLTICLWCVFSHCSNLCILRPLQILWSPKHQHNHSSTHWSLRDLPEPLEVKVLSYPSSHLARPQLFYHIWWVSERLFPPVFQAVVGEKLDSSLNFLSRIHILKKPHPWFSFPSSSAVHRMEGKISHYL